MSSTQNVSGKVLHRLCWKCNCSSCV